MNPSKYLASRLYKSDGYKAKDKLRTVILISVLSLSISLLIMLFSGFIVKGFQKTIKDKISSFDAHLKVSNSQFSSQIQQNAIEFDEHLIAKIKEHKHVLYASPFIEKGAIIKTDQQVQGILLKGIDGQFRSDFFDSFLKQGTTLSLSSQKAQSEVILSERLAEKLQLNIGDAIKIYFVQKPVRVRKLKVVGLYNSDFEQFDQHYLFCDMRHLQKLNAWTNTQIQGYEIMLDDFQNAQQVEQEVLDLTQYGMHVEKIDEKHAEIFGWLSLLDMNVYVVLFFACLVCLINIVSTFIIMLIDKTQFIALMKVLGASNSLLSKTFSILGLRIVMLGLLIGNMLAFSLAFIQQKFKIFTLSAEAYYVQAIPIYFDLKFILISNGLVICCLLFCIILPSLIIARISPSKAIKFS